MRSAWNTITTKRNVLLPYTTALVGLMQADEEARCARFEVGIGIKS